ncbi:protein L [Pseudomonas fluorescens]|uniref:protein L n=1 Tax=Pseudomonas fluorescens TaxID=294 RepID=UPI0009B6C98D|nr:protein L [Pseudomonas fluorescens]
MAEVIANTAHYVQKIAPTRRDDVDQWQYVYSTGSAVPASGIYRCTGCGDEITSNKGDKFPPQNRHQHTDPKIEVQWQLIVRTQTKS